MLKSGFMLPPLMFSEEEIEATVLGSHCVADRGDDRLGLTARDALAQIASVPPEDLRGSLDVANLLVGPGIPLIGSDVNLAVRIFRGKCWKE